MHFVQPVHLIIFFFSCVPQTVLTGLYTQQRPLSVTHVQLSVFMELKL